LFFLTSQPLFQFSSFALLSVVANMNGNLFQIVLKLEQLKTNQYPANQIYALLIANATLLKA